MASLFVLIFLIVAAYSARNIFSSASEPVELGSEETAIGEILVKTDDLKHRPMRIGYPHNDAGRLVLTNLRLLYLSYDQKKTTLAVPLTAISQAEVGKKEGFLTSTPAVTVVYQKDRRPVRTTWSVPSKIVDYGNPLFFMGTQEQVNRLTADEFVDFLNRAKHPSTAALLPRLGGEHSDLPDAATNPGGESIFCYRCGQKLPYASRFCKRCGAAQQGRVKQTEEIPNAERLHCASCGTYYDPRDYRDDAAKIYCTHCQAELPRRPSK